MATRSSRPKVGEVMCIYRFGISLTCNNPTVVIDASQHTLSHKFWWFILLSEELDYPPDFSDVAELAGNISTASGVKWSTYCLHISPTQLPALTETFLNVLGSFSPAKC